MNLFPRGFVGGSDEAAEGNGQHTKRSELHQELSSDPANRARLLSGLETQLLPRLRPFPKRLKPCRENPGEHVDRSGEGNKPVEHYQACPGGDTFLSNPVQKLSFV